MPQISRGVGVSIVLLFVCAGAYALQHDLRQLPSMSVLPPWNLLILAAVLSLGNYALRIYRWRMYLARLGHRLPHRFAALTYVAGFAYTLSPGKVGEMARARYYTRHGVPLSDVAAAFLVERLLDVVVMVALAGLIASASARYRAATFTAAALAAVAVVALAVLPWKTLATRIDRAGHLPAWLRSSFLQGTRSLSAARELLRPSMLAVGFLVGLLAWGFEGVGLDVLSSYLPGAHLGLSAAMGIYGLAVLVGGLSLVPGGLGSAEAVMTALIVTHGYPLADALLLTLLCRLLTLWLGVGLGWLAVTSLRQRAQPA
ncbi:MAG TPA: lysylphosphatidylglycerol synthase transmembrane domain-containing protein [Steroidobacteraceae bacterium]|nr:lysylphosphatidylglycerol synthase transmembrane domain-containing protein [Steroidobacteraceae bacterium]